MKEKLLSIIVPIYNAEADLKRCLDALLAQTYQPLEIILIDDGSTDGSFAVCQAYAQSNAGICCYHQPNGGVSSARNKGLSMAHGEIIGFCDADDWVDAAYYARMVNLMQEHDAQMVFSGYEEFFEKSGASRLHHPAKSGLVDGYEALRQCVLPQRDGYFTSLWNKLFQREMLLDEAGKLFTFPLDIAVVHVNHGIRPEAGEDARYVEKLCGEHRIPFFLTEADVRQRSILEKCSEEEAGRRTRYEAFDKAAEEWGATKIAVAHNSNDRSETQLFHLFRGSGIRGLASILPVRGRIIRPILCLERWEIEDFLTQQGIFYCKDATNDEDDYTRNRIRHHILPYAEQNIARGCVAHMNQTAEMLAETEEYLELQTAEAVNRCIRSIKAPGSALQPDVSSQAQEVHIAVEPFLTLHPVIRKRLLYEEVKRLSPGQKDITYQHIAELLTLFTQEGNRTICLPFGIRGRRQYEQVILMMQTTKTADSDLQTAVATPLWQQRDPDMAPGQKKTVECALGTLEYSVWEASHGLEKNQEVPTNQYTKWFDYDKIKKCPTIRTRQTGDYLTIADGRGEMIRKSLKSYFVDQKIPREERDRLPILAEEDHVLWVMGYRISEYYKVTENTKRILKVQLIRKEFA